MQIKFLRIHINTLSNILRSNSDYVNIMNVIKLQTIVIFEGTRYIQILSNIIIFYLQITIQIFNNSRKLLPVQKKIYNLIYIFEHYFSAILNIKIKYGNEILLKLQTIFQEIISIYKKIKYNLTHISKLKRFISKLFQNVT